MIRVGKLKRGRYGNRKHTYILFWHYQTSDLTRKLSLLVWGIFCWSDPTIPTIVRFTYILRRVIFIVNFLTPTIFTPFYLCCYDLRVITVFTVFRLLTDFVCLYTYEFWLSLWKIVRSSVILLLPIFVICVEYYLSKIFCVNIMHLTEHSHHILRPIVTFSTSFERNL
jgi:hypothetical protein